MKSLQFKLLIVCLNLAGDIRSCFRDKKRAQMRLEAALHDKEEHVSFMNNHPRDKLQDPKHMQDSIFSDKQSEVDQIGDVNGSHFMRDSFDVNSTFKVSSNC